MQAPAALGGRPWEHGSALRKAVRVDLRLAGLALGRSGHAAGMGRKGRGGD